jgi:hypothetical protein
LIKVPAEAKKSILFIHLFYLSGLLVKAAKAKKTKRKRGYQSINERDSIATYLNKHVVGYYTPSIA